MEKMLALGTEEALSCARLSPEGDIHDDSVEGNHYDDDVGGDEPSRLKDKVFTKTIYQI